MVEEATKSSNACASTSEAKIAALVYPVLIVVCLEPEIGRRIEIDWSVSHLATEKPEFRTEVFGPATVASPASRRCPLATKKTA